MVYFNIKHITSYKYEGEVYDNKNLIKMHPVDDNRQKVISHFISISRNPKINLNTDVFGNKFGIFTLHERHTELTISSTIEVQTVIKDIYADVSRRKHSWDNIFMLSMDNSFQLFLNQKEYNEIWEMRNLVNSFNYMSKNPLDVILEFNTYVYNNFRYDTNATTVYTTLYEVWNLKAGVCQDFAHILISMLRLVNIPARYVSGYICPNNNGMRGDGASHAWVEAYLPNYGWLGVDPTNNCIAQEKHVRVAFGRNYNDVAPVKGVYKGSALKAMSVVVSVSYNQAEVLEIL